MTVITWHYNTAEKSKERRYASLYNIMQSAYQLLPELVAISTAQHEEPDTVREGGL